MGAPPRWGAHRRSHSRRTAKLGSGGTARQDPFRPSGELACGRDPYRSRWGIGPLAVAEECERLDVSSRQLAEFARDPVELLGPVPEFSEPQIRPPGPARRIADPHRARLGESLLDPVPGRIAQVECVTDPRIGGAEHQVGGNYRPVVARRRLERSRGDRRELAPAPRRLRAGPRCRPAPSRRTGSRSAPEPGSTVLRGRCISPGPPGRSPSGLDSVSSLSGRPHPDGALRAGKGTPRRPACMIPSPHVLTTRTSASRSRKTVDPGWAPTTGTAPRTAVGTSSRSTRPRRGARRRRKGRRCGRARPGRTPAARTDSPSRRYRHASALDSLACPPQSM